VGVAQRRTPLLKREGRMLLNCRAAAGCLAVLLLFGGTAKAEEKEPSAVVAIGPEGEWGFPGSRFVSTR